MLETIHLQKELDTVMATKPFPTEGAKKLLNQIYYEYAKALRLIMYIADQKYGNCYDVKRFYFASTVKADIELFFESESFNRLSMNKFIKGDPVAIRIQKKIGYSL